MKKNVKIISAVLLLLIYAACSTSNKETSDKDNVSDPDTFILDNEMTDEISNHEQPDADEQENNLEEGPYGILFGETEIGRAHV